MSLTPNIKIELETEEIKAEHITSSPNTKPGHKITGMLIKEEFQTKCDCTDCRVLCICIAKCSQQLDIDCFNKHEIKTEKNIEIGTIGQVVPTNNDTALTCLNSTGLCWDEEKISISDVKVEFSTQKELNIHKNNTLFEPQISERITKQLKVVPNEVLYDSQIKKEVDIKSEMQGPKIILNDILCEPWTGRKIVLRDLTVLLVNLKDDLNHVGNFKTRAELKRKTLICKHCEYRTIYSGHFEKHVERHMNPRKPKPEMYCYKCPYKTQVKYLLRKHQITHSKIKPFQCKFCTKRFLREKQLQLHRFCKHADEIPDLERKIMKKKMRYCNLCPFKTMYSTLLNSHMASSHHNLETPKFSCDKCNYTCFVKTRIITHLRKHVDVNRLSCMYCDSTLKNRGSLMKHLFYVHKEERHNLYEVITHTIHKCQFCDYQTLSRRTLANHIRNKHKKLLTNCHCQQKQCQKCNLSRFLTRYSKIPKTFMCNYCKMQFEEKRQLNMHLFKQHRNDMQQAGEVFSIKIYNCKWCEYQSISSAHVSQHVAAKHKNMVTPDFKCTLCGREFYRKTNLTKHLEAHSDVKQFTCKPCGVEFKQKRYFDTHIFIHHKDDKKLMKSISYKIYECPHCSFATSYADRLDSHRKSSKAHKIPKIFKCNYCEMLFEIKRHLNMHLFKQHRNDMQKAGENFPRKIYNCKWCEYQNLNPGNLGQHVVANHKNMLTPEFKCGICKREFYLKYHFTKHVKAHADGKRFSCKPCGVAFIQKRYMDTHIFIHHKDDKMLLKSITYEIYECPDCSYATSYADRLDSHIRSIAHGK